MRVAALAIALATGGAASAQTITAADFTDPTNRYDHGILGDAIEWGSLRITVAGAAGPVTYSIVLPDDLVFEDVAPRLWDVTGDGAPEVVVVQSSLTQGARMQVWGLAGGAVDLLAATDFIGQTHRWLAPAGAADLDGDGRIEIAYVDRPHLARVLRILRYVDGEDGKGTLKEVAAVSGLTNHRIGDSVISGGLRDCAGQASIVTASPDWSRVLATRFDGTTATTVDLGPNDTPNALRDALACEG
jgi:hypothetical protein